MPPVASAASAPSVADVPTKPLFDQAVWSAVPSIVWALVVVGILWFFREELTLLIQAFISRLRTGASVKVAGLEIGASSGLVATPGDFSKEDTRVGVYKDDKAREKHRHELYEESRGVMLVHRLQHSNSDGQLYDILVYVVPHKASLAGVVTVEYFFGSYWGNKVYPSHDRSRGFPVVTSAYGSFLCTAKVIFNDGTSTFISRYIDFEMGNCVTRPVNAS